MEKAQTHHNTQRLIGYGLVSSLALTALVGCEKGKPTASCDDLKGTRVSGRTYEFETAYSTSDGAKLQEVDYNFGYGQKPKNVYNDDPVRHTFPSGQEYVVTATPYFYLPGLSDDAEPRESPNCSFTVPK